MRIFLGGPAENLREPPHPSLMRHVNKRAVAEDIGQAAGTIIRLRDFLRRPNVLPPSQKRQRKEASDDDCKNGCQNPPSHFYMLDRCILKGVRNSTSRSMVPFLSRMLKQRTQSK